MRILKLIALTIALIVSTVANSAYAKALKIDPMSPLGQQAVSVALVELEGRGLNKEDYTAEVYTRKALVTVLFRPLFSDSDDDSDSEDDSDLIEGFQVDLNSDATRIVNSHFVR